MSAAFELTTHELLVRAGCKIVGIDQPVANGKSPDFLVELPDRSRIFIECVLATGKSFKQIAGERRLASALAVINAEVSADFFWEIRPCGIPEQPIRLSDLKAALRQWAASLNYEAVAACDQAGDEWNRPLVYAAHGFSVEVRPRARMSTRGNPRGRGIGAQLGEAVWGSGHEAVRDAIIFKAKKYGTLEHPLVIAVNAMNDLFDESDVIDALFGTPTIRVNMETHEARETRDRDGVWMGPRGPRNRGVHGVFVARHLRPWSIGQRAALKVLNPFVANEVVVPLPGSTTRVLNERVTVEGGEGIWAALDLPQDWPRQVVPPAV